MTHLQTPPDAGPSVSQAASGLEAFASFSASAKKTEKQPKNWQMPLKPHF